MKNCCINKSQLQSLSRELEVLMQQLQADLTTELADQQQALSQVGVTEVLDRGEAATVAEQQQASMSHITQLREEIIECQNALQRVEEGRYGYCERCGEEIELNRLMANPVAVLCVGCQSRDELQRNSGRVAL